MANLKAVIFDMDGVIIDSEPIHYQVNQKLYADLNIEISDEEYNNFIGVSNKDHWQNLKEKYNLTESIEELLTIQNEKNIEHLETSNEEPIPGIPRLLTELEETGIKIGLASSSALSYIKAVIGKFSLTDYFSVMISGEEMERGKPYPDVFLEAAKKLEVDPVNCVVIEDSKNGVKAAKSAGMNCIGYLNPNSGKQDLSQADIIVDSLEKITLRSLERLFSSEMI